MCCSSTAVLEDLRHLEQLEPEERQDREDPREYCYGTSLSLSLALSIALYVSLCVSLALYVSLSQAVSNDVPAHVYVPVGSILLGVYVSRRLPPCPGRRHLQQEVPGSVQAGLGGFLHGLALPRPQVGPTDEQTGKNEKQDQLQSVILLFICSIDFQIIYPLL